MLQANTDAPNLNDLVERLRFLLSYSDALQYVGSIEYLTHQITSLVSAAEETPDIIKIKQLVSEAATFVITTLSGEPASKDDLKKITKKYRTLIRSIEATKDMILEDSKIIDFYSKQIVTSPDQATLDNLNKALDVASQNHNKLGAYLNQFAAKLIDMQRIQSTQGSLTNVCYEAQLFNDNIIPLLKQLRDRLGKEIIDGRDLKGHYMQQLNAMKLSH